MKIAVLGDIHANYQAFKSVLEDIDHQKVDKIISLGDNIGYGPEPNQVVQALSEGQIPSVMGNHEFGLVNRRYYNFLNPTARTSLAMNLEALGQEEQKLLAKLPPLLIDHGARFVHGCPPKSPTAYLFHPTPKLLAKLFNSFDERICFYGHTHAITLLQAKDGICGIRNFGPGLYRLDPASRYIINPGSVGQPRDEFNNFAKYLIWDQEESFIRVRSVPYDVKQTINKLVTAGYPEFNSQRLLLR